MVGEAGGAGLQARRARLRLAVAAASAAALCGLACAYQGDPPGGPPRTTPPVLLATDPESGAVLATPPRRVDLSFDEVVAERIAAQRSDIGGAVLLSPVTTRVSVGWHRYRLTVSPKGGFRPGLIYRLDLLPVLVDLHNNRMKVGRTIIFSTGPPIPTATIGGTVVDWAQGRAAVNALIEAVLLPDSLPYRALADSAGSFVLADVPTGEYLVYGVIDQNGNRQRDPREAFDTARVELADSAHVELWAFAHDTVGPRLRSVDFVDTATLRITFDRPIDPGSPVDSSMVHVAPAEDSTASVPIAGILTPSAYDSLVKAQEARAARDTSGRADTTRRAAPPPAPGRPQAAPRPAAAAPPPPLAAPGVGRAPAPPPQRPETTLAMRMAARRPPPTDTRVVRLAAPLVRDARYVVTAGGVAGLTGVPGKSAQIRLLVPAAPKRSAADTLHGRADSLTPAPPADTARRDTTPPSRAPTPSPPPPAPRRDTMPARPERPRR